VTGRDRYTESRHAKIAYDYWIEDGSTQSGVVITTAADIPIIEHTKYFAAAGSIFEVDLISDAPPFAVATSPSRTTYTGWITTDASTPSSWSLVVEDSKITRWLGHIWQRRTIYVKAW